MLRIAIVDDDKACLDLASEMLTRYIYESAAPDVTFNCFRTPFDLLDAVENGTDFDVFLLDILMPGMTGIDVARNLRKMGVGVPIIFLTVERDYALDAFSVGAMQYLVKGCNYQELKAAMDRAIKIVCGQRRRRIVFNTREGYRHIFCRSIVYTVANRNYQHIIMDDGETLEVRMSHKVLAEKLVRSPNFISVGSSYVVNMFYITKLTSDSITMMDSFQLQVPQRQSVATVVAYRRFISALSQRRPDLQ